MTKTTPCDPWRCVTPTVLLMDHFLYRFFTFSEKSEENLSIRSAPRIPFFSALRLSASWRVKSCENVGNIYMLFSGWEVRIVKNCDRALENAARGRGRHFQDRGHSFPLYGPTLSRQITHFFFPAVYWLASGFVYATLSLNWLTCRLQTSAKNLTSERASERASNSDTIQRKMY